MSLFRKALGLENEEIGKMEPELEHVFWVKVNQPDFLHGAVSAVLFVCVVSRLVTVKSAMK